MRARAILWLLALAVAAPAAAQVPEPAPAVPDTVQTVPADEDFEALVEGGAEGDPEVLLDALLDLRDNPLDVNTATAGELALLPALDATLASAIVRDRAENGPFASLPQLTRVPGVTPDVYLAARPYLTIGARLATGAQARTRRFPAVPSAATVRQGLRTTATQRVTRRLSPQAGYAGPDSLRTYPGGPERIYTRATATYRRQLSLNLTLETDPGERFRWEPGTYTYGYDFVSAHAAVLDVGRIDALVVGDFVAEFGQGVALWRASGFGKGPDAVGGPVRTGRGIRPYGSVDENNFFRGAALSAYLTPRVVATAFGSYRRRTASTRPLDSLDFADPDIPPGALDGTIVTSLNADGLHRTPREIERKGALGEALVGSGAEYRLTTPRVDGRAGVVATHGRYSSPLAEGTRPDNRFAFAGDRATTVSAYADARTRAGQAFAEVARGAGGGVGAVGGLGADLGGGAQILAVARHYGRDFTTLHGYPFGERNGIGQNETGVYLGARLRPTRTWTVNAYVDQYRFDWLRFNVGRPTVGHEALALVEHRPSRYVRVYTQARTETREGSRTELANVVPGSTVRGVGDETRQTLRLHGEWDATRRLRLRARVEGSRFAEAIGGGAQEVQTGALVYQDVRYEIVPTRLRVDTRLTFFRTDGFDARLFAYENDLAGVFSIPALNGRGARGYVLVRAVPVAGLTLEAKLATTWLRGVRSIGSGPQRVDSDRVTDVGIQARYRF